MKIEKEPDPTLQVVGCAGMLIAIIPVWIYGGWVTATVWNWIAVPHLGLRPLSVPLAIGLGLVVSRFKTSPTPAKEKDNIKLLVSLIGSGVVWPTLTLAIAWALQRWWL